MSLRSITLSLVLTLCVVLSTAQNTFFQWFPGSATFYGGSHGHETMGGACGYGNVNSFGVGTLNAAAASFLWKSGKGCGGCFEVKCDPSKNRKEYCLNGKSVTITVTNMCPRGGLGWCNPPRRHLDMSQPAYTQIAIYRSGYVNTMMRRVPCKRQGNIKFKTGGNPWFFTVVVFNIAGFGELSTVSIQVDNPKFPWFKLRQNWGALYSISRRVYKARLNIKLVLGNGQSLLISKALPTGWSIGATYSAGQFSGGNSGRRKFANRRLKASNKRTSDTYDAASHMWDSASAEDSVGNVEDVIEPVIEEPTVPKRKGGHHKNHHQKKIPMKRAARLALAEKAEALKKVQFQLDEKMEEARKVLDESRVASESLKAVQEEISVAKALVEDMESAEKGKVGISGNFPQEIGKVQVEVSNESATSSGSGTALSNPSFEDKKVAVGKVLEARHA